MQEQLKFVLAQSSIPTDLVMDDEILVWKSKRDTATLSSTPDYRVLMLTDNGHIVENDLFYDERPTYRGIYFAESASETVIRADTRVHPRRYCTRVIASNVPEATPRALILPEAVRWVIKRWLMDGKIPTEFEVYREYRNTFAAWKPLGVLPDYVPTSEVRVVGFGVRHGDVVDVADFIEKWGKLDGSDRRNEFMDEFTSVMQQLGDPLKCDCGHQKIATCIKCK